LLSKYSHDKGHTCLSAPSKYSTNIPNHVPPAAEAAAPPPPPPAAAAKPYHYIKRKTNEQKFGI
jgi:hypothetical protein